MSANPVYCAPMITVMVLDRESGKLEIGRDPKTIDVLCADEKKVVWVDVLRPTEDDYAMLADEFRFHPLAIEDCRNAHQRPKIDEYKGYYFMVLYEASIVGKRKSLELNELNLFLGTNYLVTIHRNPLRAVDTAARLWPEWDERVTSGAGLLAYLLIDAVIDEYMPLLDDMSDRIDDIEDEIFESFDPAVHSRDLPHQEAAPVPSDEPLCRSARSSTRFFGASNRSSLARSMSIFRTCSIT